MLGEILVNNSDFNITMQPQDLAILSIPIDVIPKCSWWIFREYSQSRKSSDIFRFFLLDDDGLSLVCEASALSTLRYLLEPENIIISPQFWNAFVITLSGNAYEVPGAVHRLADSLSEKGLSIFHISTYDAEVFLVQKNDLAKATDILKEFDNPTRVESLLESARNLSVEKESFFDLQSRPSEDDCDESGDFNNNIHVGNGSNFDMSWFKPQQNQTSNDRGMQTKTREGLFLKVLPEPVILTKLNNEGEHWEACWKILSDLLFFQDSYSPLEEYCKEKAKEEINDINSRFVANRAPELNTKATFMWGVWQRNDETTILLQESLLDLFPPDALIISPQPWRVIKLSGRAIKFDETGIVQAMSCIEMNIPSLNISTATTNCALVPEEMLEPSLESLSIVLRCQIEQSS